MSNRFRFAAAGRSNGTIHWLNDIIDVFQILLIQFSICDIGLCNRFKAQYNINTWQNIALCAFDRVFQSSYCWWEYAAVPDLYVCIHLMWNWTETLLSLKVQFRVVFLRFSSCCIWQLKLFISAWCFGFSVFNILMFFYCGVCLPADSTRFYVEIDPSVRGNPG